MISAMGTGPDRFQGALPALLAALLVGSALCLPAPAAAQAQAGSSARSEAIVLRPLSFFKVDDLELGGIIPATGSAGTVRLQPNGTRTATGGVVLIGNTHQPARFAGMGTSNQQVAISLQASNVWLTGPGAPMRLRNFEIGSTPTAMLSTTPLRFRISSATGAYSFPIGATLDIGANQVPGDYTGTFTIILNYM